MTIVICPKCKGKGEVVQIKWLSAIMTLGITALSDLSFPDMCPVCNGKGIVDTYGVGGIDAN